MDMFDLATRSRARMLDFQRDGPIERGIMVHREAFIRIGAPSLAAAIDRAGIIVMDELGRFECDVPEFMSCVFAALDSSKPVIGVLKDESNPFLDAIRARHDVQVVRLERDSRDQVGIEFRSLLQRLSRR
jgi:nucleoside-triphosphatase